KWLIQQKRKSCTSGLWSGFQGADAPTGMRAHATHYVAGALRKSILGLGAKTTGSRLLLTRHHLDMFLDIEDSMVDIFMIGIIGFYFATQLSTMFHIWWMP